MSQPFELFTPAPDPELEEVAAELRRLDPDGSKWAAIVRHTFDMVYNGQETGRYRWDQLMKTEKTHFGTLFEINAQREFGFEDGEETDYRIAGHQVDAKWSQRLWGWMLPPEVFDRLALVGTGSDEESYFSLGLVRVTEGVRRDKGNRDQKTQIKQEGHGAVRWLWKDAPIPHNVLLQLERKDPAIVEHIFDNRYGTKRTDRLFRAAEGMLVHRTAVATVSRQLDAQKRVRANGGSRDVLGPEGYLILSGTYLNQRNAAEALGVPVPRSNEYISVRVVPSEDGTGAEIAGKRWRRARKDEQCTEPAPIIEDSGKKASD
jgi:hypothetical protein